MIFTHQIIFYDEIRQKLRITREEFLFFQENLNKNQFLHLRRTNEIYNRSDIRRIEQLPVEKKPLQLPEYHVKIPKELIKKEVEKVKNRFAWN